MMSNSRKWLNQIKNIDSGHWQIMEIKCTLTDQRRQDSTGASLSEDSTPGCPPSIPQYTGQLGETGHLLAIHEAPLAAKKKPTPLNTTALQSKGKL
jgi:hypothetical protein